MTYVILLDTYSTIFLFQTISILSKRVSITINHVLGYGTHIKCLYERGRAASLFNAYCTLATGLLE